MQDDQTRNGPRLDRSELRPPVFTAATVLGDPALDPERIVDSGRVSWEEIAAESKELPF